MKDNNIMIVLKGMIVGGTMLVPGISGGSMAMILGVYDRLVASVSSFMKHKRESLLFLALFSIGGGAGMLLFAAPLMNLIERYPMPMLYFFLGAVAGGIPLIMRQAEIKRFSAKVPLYIVLGLLTVSLLAKLPNGVFEAGGRSGAASFLFLAAAGFIAAVALVLPGISVSYLLLMLGLYEEMMRAISALYLPFLIPLGIGLLLGILMTTRLLESAMARQPEPTYLIILGFVLGSMAEVFPGVPSGPDILSCIGMLAAGFIVIRLISKAEIEAQLS